MKTPLIMLTAMSTMWVTCDAVAETKPVPLTMTITCSDKVDPGMMILSNPPKVNCKDLKMMNRFVGTGFEVGPFNDHKKVVDFINKEINDCGNADGSKMPAWGDPCNDEWMANNGLRI